MAPTRNAAAEVGRLIVTADDAGVSDSIDEAIIDLARKGAITALAAFANFGRLDHIKSAQRYCDLTLHLNISSGHPLTRPQKIPHLLDDRGAFRSPMSLVRDEAEALEKAIQRYGELVLSAIPISEIGQEFQEQLAQFISIIGSCPNTGSVHHDLDKFFSVDQSLRTCVGLPQCRQQLLRAGKLSGFRYLFCAKGETSDGHVERVRLLISEGLGTSRARDGKPFEIALHPAKSGDQLSDFTAYREGREIEYEAWRSPMILKILAKGVRSGPFLEFCDRTIDEVV